ncbi:hypothetical protein C7458_105161 [Williamsia muralis]|nr:hypothetical protein C7458_105161 [Williamsia marianensis]
MTLEMVLVAPGLAIFVGAWVRARVQAGPPGRIARGPVPQNRPSVTWDTAPNASNAPSRGLQERIET